MSVQMINHNSPKLKIPSLFGSSQDSLRKIPNPLRFTTESSLEETNKLVIPKSKTEKKPKASQTTENWFG
ncbi:MAG: hypothetical protein Q8S39_12180 [Ignavibacteria bacterium]|nr:hypothetical protein [Ignavibacteria bacterium]MDP3582685.1 hypothetical protein [Ignavibacteria bacterium]